MTHIAHHEHASSSTQSDEPRPKMAYKESGALINRTETVDARWEGAASNRGLMWPRIRHYMRKPFSEFMGTFILIMFGDGVVAQVVLSNDQKGNYQSINWGWVSQISSLSNSSILWTPVSLSIGSRRVTGCIHEWHLRRPHQPCRNLRQLRV